MRRIGLGGNSASAALAGAGGIGIVQFLAVFPAILYIDKLGELMLSPHMEVLSTEYRSLWCRQETFTYL
jgi:hypothetical protein